MSRVSNKDLDPELVREMGEATKTHRQKRKAEEVELRRERAELRWYTLPLAVAGLIGFLYGASVFISLFTQGPSWVFRWFGGFFAD